MRVQDRAKAKYWVQIGANYRKFKGVFNMLVEQARELSEILASVDVLRQSIIQRKGMRFYCTSPMVGTLSWEGFGTYDSNVFVRLVV